LVAGAGSSSFGGRLFVHHAPTGAYASRAWRKIWFQFLSLRAAASADVVVNFGRLDYLTALLRTSKPIVSCFQNPVSQAEVDWLLARRNDNLALVGVSQSQITGLDHAGMFSVVHNVADTEQMKYSAAPAQPPYLAFLGRITSNKGADTAINVALRAGVSLKLGGNISDEPSGREFFETKIRPRLGPGVEWLGPVNDQQKQELLAGAVAMLFPIRWNEPFALVVPESLACGTPVIATRCASTPEIIVPGKTGFLCDSEDEMVAAVKRIGEIDRAGCRSAAEVRFSPQALVEGYLSAIRTVLSPVRSGVARNGSLNSGKGSQPARQIQEKLRVLVIADPHLPVPPEQYGGTERVVALVCKELQSLGHTVDLVAGPGSHSFGGCLFSHTAPTPSYLSRVFRKSWFQLLSVALLARRPDVVLNFGRLDYLETLLRTRIPIVCRFGNPVFQKELDWVLDRRRHHLRFIGISRAQMGILAPQELIDIVPNSTVFSDFTPRPAAAETPYLAFLGRLTSNKGVDTAITVALRAGMRLKIAGNISDEPGGREFFERMIRPQIGGNIEYLGPVNDVQKRQLLGGASGLLFPIRWDEPFGIVMVESLACGTPVVATRCASTPEVIRHGVTGFLCDTLDEMVESCRHLAEIDRDLVRKEAKNRFSPEAMVQQYINVMQATICDAR